MDRLAVVTSCLPGLVGAMLDEFARAYELNDEQARELLIDSALGSLALARRDAAGLRGLVSAVSNPGGLTEAGISIIRDRFPLLFEQLRHALDYKQAQWRQHYRDF